MRPFQEANGRLLPDGGIDWLTGEALMPLTWIALTLPMGLMAYRSVRKSYSQP